MGEKIKAATKSFFEKYKLVIMPAIIAFLLGLVMPVSSNVVKICQAPAKIEDTRKDIKDNYATKAELKRVEDACKEDITHQEEMTDAKLNTIDSKVTMLIQMQQGYMKQQAAINNRRYSTK